MPDVEIHEQSRSNDSQFTEDETTALLAALDAKSQTLDPEDVGVFLTSAPTTTQLFIPEGGLGLQLQIVRPSGVIALFQLGEFPGITYVTYLRRQNGDISDDMIDRPDFAESIVGHIAQFMLPMIDADGVVA